jgi:hypothetical protein
MKSAVPLVLDDYKSWFKNDEAFEDFCDVLKEAFAIRIVSKTGTKEDIIPVVLDGGIVCGIVSAKVVLNDRLVRLITKKPEILDDLYKSLSEEPEDWDD